MNKTNYAVYDLDEITPYIWRDASPKPAPSFEILLAELPAVGTWILYKNFFWTISLIVCEVTLGPATFLYVRRIQE